MSLEAILTEIRDELKESNRLKKQQTDSFKDFSKSKRGDWGSIWKDYYRQSNTD